MDENEWTTVDLFGRHRVPITNGGPVTCHVGYMDDDGRWRELATLPPGATAMVADKGGRLYAWTEHGETRVLFDVDR